LSQSAEPVANGDLVVDIRRDGGRVDGFRVRSRPGQTVLDVVTHIQRRLDPTLAYRFACRVGMCGSCAMTVNGVPRWTCRTSAADAARRGRIEIAPLRNFPVIKDLAVDMAGFFAKAQEAGAVFQPSRPATAGFARVDPAGSERRAVDAGIECIGCGICHAACDVVAADPDYAGPAALARVWTLVNDERDGQRAAHLAAVATDSGCLSCHSQGSCARHCPNGLDPTAAIAGLKRAVVKAALKRNL
jgi:fumarate reductase iron-sulfur subunit